MHAYEKGYTIRIFGNYFLSKKYFKGHLPNTFLEIEKLHRDINTRANDLKSKAEDETQDVKKQNRHLRMTHVDHTDNLYSLIVQQANIRVTSERELENFKRQNKVVLKYVEAEAKRWITQISVIRQGKPIKIKQTAQLGL